MGTSLFIFNNTIGVEYECVVSDNYRWWENAFLRGNAHHVKVKHRSVACMNIVERVFYLTKSMYLHR